MSLEGSSISHGDQLALGLFAAPHQDVEEECGKELLAPADFLRPFDHEKTAAVLSFQCL